MDKAKLENVMIEINRFTNKANDYFKANENLGIYASYTAKEAGALRRASLDLTRVLAMLRSYK